MEQNDKQLAVEKIKSASNVLVTVSANPTVDDLSAAIGLSLLLGKLDKHATAVFSGSVPPAINFLEPQKQFDSDVGSLRDFIIALDKDKADKLRYKVEDDVVRIFITPYKTRLSKDDLTFSEGDFNVDVVVALGVGNRDDIDNAIKAHGRILHDAAVVTINSGSRTSSIGAVNWQDPSASSLCEMLVSISESFGSGLLDQQIATAFLTGIVAATERFSNTKTTPKVMTMSAQLMAAGANQQLIAANVMPSNDKPAPPPQEPPAAAGQDQNQDQISITHDSDAPSEGSAQQQQPQALPLPPPIPDTYKSSVPPDLPVMPEPPLASQPVPPDLPLPEPFPSAVLPGPLQQQAHNSPTDVQSGKTLTEVESELAQLGQASSNQNDMAPQTTFMPTTAPVQDEEKLDHPSRGFISDAHGHGPRQIDDDPSMGGTFNATSQQAHEDSVSDLKRNVNAKLLSHPGQRLSGQEPTEQTAEAKAAPLQPLGARFETDAQSTFAMPPMSATGSPVDAATPPSNAVYQQPGQPSQTFAPTAPPTPPAAQLPPVQPYPPAAPAPYQPAQPSAQYSPQAPSVPPFDTTPQPSVPQPDVLSQLPPPPQFDMPPEPVQPAAEAPAPAVGDVDAARRAVEEALGNTPFEPENHPIESLNSQELGSIQHNDTPPITGTFKLPGQN